MLGASGRFKHVRTGLILLLFVVACGVVGLMVIERYPLLDALYMTIITISTVGFQEVRTLSNQGHLLVMFLIITGLSVMTYTLGALVQIIIEGQFRKLLGRRRMQREIETIADHYLICGHGRMGEILCQELRHEKVPFVVIEGEAALADELCEQGYLVVVGDATQDEILERAGIHRARGLVAVVSSDVDNLYITLSAREMTRQTRPGFYILARATDQHAMQKISRAGANRVISPYYIGGMRIVQALLRPTAYDFIEVVTQSSGLDLMVEELRVGERSALVDKALKDSGIRQKYDIIIIGIKKSSGDMIFNPGPSHIIESGDVLVVLGDHSQVAELGRALT
jgi:voltage-gated potassium channel